MKPDITSVKDKRSLALLVATIYSKTTAYFDYGDVALTTATQYHTGGYSNFSLEEILEAMNEAGRAFVISDHKLYTAMYLIYSHVKTCVSEFDVAIWEAIKQFEDEIINPNPTTNIFNLYDKFSQAVIETTTNYYYKEWADTDPEFTRGDTYATIREHIDRTKHGQSEKSLRDASSNVIHLFDRSKH